MNEVVVDMEQLDGAIKTPDPQIRGRGDYPGVPFTPIEDQSFVPGANAQAVIKQIGSGVLAMAEQAATILEQQGDEALAEGEERKAAFYKLAGQTRELGKARAQATEEYIVELRRLTNGRETP